MGQIEAVQVGVNPYGGSGAATRVQLYNYNGCDEMTLGQLVNAVCVRIGVALETQSVNKSNIINRGSRRLQALAEALDGIVKSTMNYDSKLTSDGFAGMTVRDFLTKEMGYAIDGSATGLPLALNNTSDRLTIYARVKGKLDSESSASQKDMVDLQTYLSRRDVAYSTATNSVRTTGACLQAVAANY